MKFVTQQEAVQQRNALIKAQAQARAQAQAQVEALKTAVNQRAKAYKALAEAEAKAVRAVVTDIVTPIKSKQPRQLKFTVLQNKK
jgi:hypothetical protein